MQKALWKWVYPFKWEPSSGCGLAGVKGQNFASVTCLGDAQMVNCKNVQKSYKILENQLGFLFLHAIESPNLDFM